MLPTNLVLDTHYEIINFMNIYKKQNEILVSEDGCPNGWQSLGSDSAITYENKRYVLGFANGSTIWDTARMAEDAKPKVPYSITPRQARLALNFYDLRSSVDAAMLMASQNIKDEWAFANEIRRDWPALQVLAASLGITNTQLDELFIYGATL
jgi:hypothetical protein